MTTKTIVCVSAGIDVGAETLILVIRKTAVSMKAQRFANTLADRKRLVKKLAPFPGIIVCLEATGVYYLDLAIALHAAGIRIMVLNPKASHHFAQVLLRHSKTDAVDADTLAQYAERMPYQPWARPADEALALRCLARRINTLTRNKAAAKNQRHALTFSPQTPKAVLRDLKLAIAQLEKRIDGLTEEAKTFIQAHPALARPFALLLTVKSIGKRARLSKAGNRYIRQALYMPALSAKAHDPHVKGFFAHLIVNGKTPLQAVCAVMRKLLHAIHGMLTHHQPFDNTRFYTFPA